MIQAFSLLNFVNECTLGNVYLDAMYHRVLNIDSISHLLSSRGGQACKVITPDLVQENVLALCLKRWIVLKVYTHLPSLC